ncbi:class I mannose-6-phosphate isomerase [Sphingobium lactosutens]|uniref:Mannose-6-phosphate isomerase n=1 Tax=Sphingobium lactosutens DS20 TaxID=1331060 RepID=T0HI74_9SPHN|nr:class I mannose-6-phosphate isomerase [Sphingobium lactosutens]EQB12722.1 mannose-6-phosphate isomerase [Sphingobium lactosutens DS20]
MTSHRLNPHPVEKPWGRTDIPACYGVADGRRIGEIWFTGPDDCVQPLLVKYLFTSERLSIQVHPDDEQARAQNHPSGKSECWYVLDTQGDARLGIGLVRPLSPEALRVAALDGSIEDLIDWKPVQPGSFYYIPAGTIHAIGGGITLVEIQQNSDITYRLYDYGRPRPLHLDEGVAVSRPKPYPLQGQQVKRTEDMLLVERPLAPFHVESRMGKAGDTIVLEQDQAWFTPISGSGVIDGKAWRAGECWLISGAAELTLETEMHALIATL